MAGKSILIVEDHTMIAEYLASVLTDAGYQAIQAASLAEARHALGKGRFDLLLCDRYLPDGEGQELLALFGAAGLHPEMPAVIMTADLDREQHAALLRFGFADALAKPCTPRAILARIRGALGGCGAAAPHSPRAVSGAPAQVLDDEAALGICAGNRDTLASMRRLFAADLPALRQRLSRCRASGDSDRLLQELHRLSASASWVGAAQVRGCCEALCRNPAAALDDLDSALARVQQVLVD